MDDLVLILKMELRSALAVAVLECPSFYSYIPRFSDTISQHFSTSLAQVAADSSAAERYCWGEMLKRRSTVSCGSLSLS
jgi:hypothetical protein